ncbi:MAG: twin-arginine translocase TatA/TatE family subunit [Betaproteobacteria bacterium]|nr:twin-arginine translocase TatA/TatE family subunit [Betaproteobacteria bacterium]
MPNIGFTELLVILAIALLLFGNRLPNVGKSLGEGIRNFKKGLDGGGDDAAKNAQTPAQQAAPQAPSIGAQSVQPNSLHSAQSSQQAKVDYVDVEHRDPNK